MRNQIALLQAICQVFQATALLSELNVHVLIFDSASTDETQNIVRGLQSTTERLHLRTEVTKSGLGNAYLQAMRYALTELTADFIVEFDADLSHQPQYLVPMLIKAQTYDVVVGSRYVRGGSIPANWEWYRKLLSVFGNYMVRLVLTAKYKDFTSGFRITRRLALINALPQNTELFLSPNYAYKLQLLWTLHKNNSRICEYPIAFIDRQKGKSKLPTNSIVDALLIIFKLRFQKLNRYLKMCIVGCCGSLIQFMVYNLLRSILSPVQAIKFAVIVAIINNFALNDRFTFKNIVPLRKFYKLKLFALFIIYSLFMVSLQSFWLKIGIKYWGGGYLQENLIILTGLIIGSLVNYLIYSRVVWR